MSPSNLAILQQAQCFDLAMSSYQDLAIKGWAFDIHDDLHFTKSTNHRWRVMVKRRISEELDGSRYFPDLTGYGTSIVLALEDALGKTLQLERDNEEFPL